MPPESQASAKEFLAAIWSDTKGWAELTAIRKPKVESFPWSHPCDTDSFLKAAENHNKTANVYIGICLRRDKWPRPTGRKSADGKPEMEYRGTEANALASWVVWCEFDFEGDGHKGRVIPADLCKKMIKEFSYPPSIVVRSGGGVQCYWLLKEPAEGDDLWRVKAINKALVAHFTLGEHGADPQAVDLARIFRLPGTMNLNYNPPRKSDISLWHPERRYLLDDFEGLLPVEEIKKPLALPSAQGSSATARPIPSTQLSEDQVNEIGKLFGDIWFEGFRHSMALRVAGMLAFAGVAQESARAVVATASNSAAGDTAGRLKDVDDTYRRFVLGEEVVGRPDLERVIEHEFQPLFRPKAKQVIEKILKLLPRPPKPPGQDGIRTSMAPDFDIVKVIKFDSRPARYTVVIRKHGEEKNYEVPCEIDTFVNIKRFRQAFTESTENKNIAPIKQWRWEQMYEATPLEIRPAPEEASLSGSIRAQLEQFLEDKKENPELGELKTFPGYNEQEVFFSLRAFKGRINDSKVKASDQAITQILQEDGWRNDRRWVGGKNPRLWTKALANGNGHSQEGANGKHGPQNLLETPPQTELFEPDQKTPYI